MMSRSRLLSPLTRCEGVAVPSRVARRTQRQAHLCLDDTERGAQFVRRVGGELELASGGPVRRVSTP